MQYYLILPICFLSIILTACEHKVPHDSEAVKSSDVTETSTINSTNLSYRNPSDINDDIRMFYNLLNSQESEKLTQSLFKEIETGDINRIKQAAKDEKKILYTWNQEINSAPYKSSEMFTIKERYIQTQQEQGYKLLDLMSSLTQQDLNDINNQINSEKLNSITKTANSLKIEGDNLLNDLHNLENQYRQ